MKKIFKWLNGKKTLIGLGIIALCDREFFQHLVNNPDILEALFWIGGILSGTGLAHKVAKEAGKQISKVK